MRVQLQTVGDGPAVYIEVPDGATEFTIPAAAQPAAPAAAPPTPGTSASAGGAVDIVHDENTVDISETGPQPDPATGAFDTTGTSAQTVNTPTGSGATPAGASVASTNDQAQHPDVFQGDVGGGDPGAGSLNAAPAEETAAATAAAAVSSGTPGGDTAPAAPAETTAVEPEPLPPVENPAPAGTQATPGQIAQALVEITGDADGQLTTEELNAYLTERGLAPVTEDEHAAVAEPAVEG